MASKRDELKAWKKLKETYPGKYCSLDLEYVHYSSDNTDKIAYKAYVESGFISASLPTPMEAVDDLIQLVKRRTGI